MEQYIADNKSFKFPEYFNKILIVLTALLFVVLICLLFVVSPMTIKGPSMQNTLHEGDHIFLQKVFINYTYGDILIVQKEATTEKKVIKRVIAMAGDYIKYNQAEKAWYRNGEKLIEDYVSCEYNDSYLDSSIVKSELLSEKGLLVKEGEIFILGDNRTISNDSHIYGCISTKQIVGKFLFKY